MRKFEEEIAGDDMKGISQHSNWWPNKVENDRLIEMIIQRHKTKVAPLGVQSVRGKYTKPGQKLTKRMGLKQ